MVANLQVTDNELLRIYETVVTNNERLRIYETVVERLGVSFVVYSYWGATCDYKQLHKQNRMSLIIDFCKFVTIRLSVTNYYLYSP
jgi:hypothetical protein